MFVWTQEELEYKSTLNSESFGIVSDIVMPINFYDIVDGNMILASIAGVGIGYGNLVYQKGSPKVIQDPKVVALRSIP